VPVVGVAGLGVVSPPSTPEDEKAFLGLLIMFLLLGAPLVIEALGVEIALDGEGIARRSPWSRDVFIPWERVRRVVWSIGEGWSSPPGSADPRPKRRSRALIGLESRPEPRI
jgi:hypothetical protein